MRKPPQIHVWIGPQTKHLLIFRAGRLKRHAFIRRSDQPSKPRKDQMQAYHLAPPPPKAEKVQRCIQFTSLDVTPDLSSNRFCSGTRYRIVPTTQAIDPLVFSINLHPDHDAAVVPSQRRSPPQDSAPSLGSGLSALAWEAKPKPHRNPPKHL